MDFALPEDLVLVRDTVARFVREELLPLEPLVIRREAERGFTDTPLLPPDVSARLLEKARDVGLWGIDVPRDLGGQEFGALAKAVVIEQLKHSIVPFVAPPDSPNLYLLRRLCRGDQVERYLLPYASGEKTSCLALTEPDAGSDMAAIRTRAERRGGKWVLNGTKTFISHARHADFIIIIAVTDPAAERHRRFSAFLVDRGTPGLSVPACYPMIGEYCPYEVVLEDVTLDDGQLLGEAGAVYEPLQARLSVRRMEVGARCIGLAERCLSMMVEQANGRSTFGRPLADRQAVQWWIADSFQELEMVRLLTRRLAWRIDSGEGDFRTDAAMVKVQATEMIQRVADRAIQLFGAMGVSKALPLEYISRVTRVYRIVEGPSEVHRWTLARTLLKNGLPVG
ncbi:MAG TPA: acyl-CoA dehydrogenase family protein [Azospirillum sp.]|nr:acyl-CoA dehydrogenase family protein [Azospirillum sp.]